MKSALAAVRGRDPWRAGGCGRRARSEGEDKFDEVDDDNDVHDDGDDEDEDEDDEDNEVDEDDDCTTKPHVGLRSSARQASRSQRKKRGVIDVAKSTESLLPLEASEREVFDRKVPNAPT